MGEALTSRNSTRKYSPSQYPSHQLIVKEERHGEHEKALSVILSLITSTSFAMIWKVLLEYMTFMESLAKRRKCKEVVFFVTFMAL